MKNKYEVYIARWEGDVMYVGEGKQGRHSHITSGISHVYLANQFHFSGKELDVEVIPLESKQLASEKEVELIKELNPKWNKGFGNAAFVRLRSNLKYRLKSYHCPVKNSFQKEFLLWLITLVDENGQVELDVSFINKKCSTMKGFTAGFISRLAVKDNVNYAKVKDIISCDKVGHNTYKFTFKDLKV